MEDELDPKDIKFILYNQLKALNFLHSANLIHRDIKPSNILIDQYSRVMICDFGMARTVPKLSKLESDFNKYRKSEYKAILKADN